MAIKIVVGGPPHSGKSTFTARLEKTLLGKHQANVKRMGLDPWDHSLEVIAGIISEKERKPKNKKITEKDLKKLASEFEQLSKKHKAVIGDLPGLPTDLTRIVARAGTHGIIVCRDDNLPEIKKWKKLFSRNKVKLIAIVHTSMKGKEKVWQDNDLIKAELVNLNKTIEVTPGMKSLAGKLKTKLDI